MSEGLFVNESAPVTVLLLAHPVIDDLMRHIGKQIRRRRQIVKVIVGYLMFDGDLAHEILDIGE